MGRAGGRQAQAGAQGAGRACVLGERTQACRQACGSRRANTTGTRGARAAGRGSRRRRAVGRGSRRGRARQGVAAGAGARGGCGAGLAGRQARGLCAGCWARGLGAQPGRWAPGLALGSAFGALSPFSIRFDSFFFLSH